MKIQFTHIKTRFAIGFITITGGHRVGIVGTVVEENSKIININNISSLNIRIAREIIGASEKILEYVLNYNSNSIYNTLIVSPPGAGKTTILRDLVRIISDKLVLNISVIDERGEIAWVFKGAPQNNIGIRTDVLSNVTKDIGMKMVIRSMAPQVIVADEIGNKNDIEAINYALCSGVKGIFTAHGDDIEDLILNPTIKILIDKNIFERIIILDKYKKGEIEKVYALDKNTKGYKKVRGEL